MLKELKDFFISHPLVTCFAVFMFLAIYIPWPWPSQHGRQSPPPTVAPDRSSERANRLRRQQEELLRESALRRVIQQHKLVEGMTICTWEPRQGESWVALFRERVAINITHTIDAGY